MAKRLVRQFKSQVAPAGARGYRMLGGNENVALQNPTQSGTAYTGKPSDDQGLKEHAAGAGGLLKIDPTVGGGGENYTLGQLLYQQKLAEANQPPPLPQYSANVPQAVDPRDFGYVPPVQPPQLPPAMAMPPQIQPPTPMPPQVVMPPQPVDLSRIPDIPMLVPPYEQPNVGIDITPEQPTLPPLQRIMHERPPVVDYGPVTTPIERPTPVEISTLEPEQVYPVETEYADPIQVDYPQPQLEEPSPAAHYGELPVPQDEITEIIDNIIPIETLAPQDIDTAPIETTQPQITTDPTEDQKLSISYPQEDPVIAGGLPEFPLGKEDYRYDVDSGPGRGNTDEYVGGPIKTNKEGAREIAEILRQQKEGTETLVDPTVQDTKPIVDDKEEFKGGPAVTTDVTGDVDTGYPGADKPLPTYDRGVPPVPEEVVVEEPTGPPVEDTVVDTTGQETPQTPPPVTQPPVGQSGWLYTGPQGYAQTRWSTSGAAQGDPVITESPKTTGPEVLRRTISSDMMGYTGDMFDPDMIMRKGQQGRHGPFYQYSGDPEIMEQPLSWWSNRAGYDFMQPGADLPTGEGFPTTTTGTGGTDTTGTTMGGGALGTGFTAEQVTEMAGGSVTPVLDYLHPGATSDGQTVTFGDVGDYDAWVDGTLDLRPDLKGINDLGYQKKDAEGNRVGWGNHALDGFNQLTGTINNLFSSLGDPDKKFTAAVLEDFGMKPTEGSNLKELAKNLNKWHEESSQMWETNQDKAWGRKWNDLTKTQEYGDMQPLGIFALLTNPPVALGMTANSLLYDIKNAVTGMFKDNPNYEGNKVQDVLNGAFHFLGKAAKSVGSLFGKLGKAVGGKLNFTSKDMKNDPMEVSRQLLYASKNADPAVGDIRYNLVKTLLEGGVDVRFHNNAITFDKGIAKARIEDIKKGISDMGLDASMIEIMAGTEGLDDFPELKAWLEELMRQKQKQAKD